MLVMARIPSAKIFSKSPNRRSTALFLIACTSIPAALPGLAAAQTHAASEMRLSGTNLCADVDNESQTQGAAVISWTCHGNANQQWLPTPSGSQYYLVNQNSNQCLDVSSSSMTAGAPVIQWACHGGANQTFSLKPQGKGYAIVALHSGMCLASASVSTQGQQILQQVCNGSAQQTWQVGGLNVRPSKWSAPISLPIVPVAAANLPDGKVLVWSADNPLSFTPGEITPGTTYTAIFDPSTATSTQALVGNTGHDMFCPGIANLPDGRVFVTGGSSSAKTSIYDPRTGSWSSAQQMNIRRGYQGSVGLSNGGVFTVGGSWNGGVGNKNGETWLPGSGWQENTAVLADYFVTNDAQGMYRADNHAWLFARSNGRVFHAGPSRAMHWIDTAGNGSVTQAGNRGNDSDAMSGNAVMYDIGKILVVGGAQSYDNSDATSNATVIDIGSGTAKTRTIGAMNYRRAFHNSVVLPSGEIVVTGGQTYAVVFSDDHAVLTSELWNPTTETFTPLATQAVPRTYHSIALLLPDGRVLSGGGGLCGTCSTNHANVEILTPPYLLNGDGSAASRPTIVSAPTEANLGTSIAVNTSSAVRAFALMRLSSITHSVNNEQRRVPLSFSRGTGGEYLLKIPADPGVLVPGYYMLFALDAKGVPSVASMLRIR
jgi:galactose oxidase